MTEEPKVCLWYEKKENSGLYTVNIDHPPDFTESSILRGNDFSVLNDSELALTVEFEARRIGTKLKLAREQGLFKLCQEGLKYAKRSKGTKDHDVKYVTLKSALEDHINTFNISVSQDLKVVYATATFVLLRANSSGFFVF